MAANYSNVLPLKVSSPFLKQAELKSRDVISELKSRSAASGRDLNSSNDRSPPSDKVKPSADSKNKNRYSREIKGIDDQKLVSPESAPVRKFLSESFDNDTNLSEGDTNSVIFNGSIASTVPDRYGFMGGTQYTQGSEKKTVPVAVIRRRELKWLQMLDEWDHYMANKYKKVKERCRKGIPSSIRPRAWQYLCGGSRLMKQNEGIFEDLLSQPGDPKWLDDIRKDLHRQFPMHEMFTDTNGPGQVELFRVLKAYSILNPVDGYFQGQAPVAAMLIMHMPAEEAFWCLVAICERYLPGYYSQGLEAVQIDGDILVHLLRKTAPAVHRHLTKQELDPILYMMEWFMCIYTRTLPWSSVLRVWDMFFCEGVKVLFRVGLVILKYTFGSRGALKSCPTMYESMEKLRHLLPGVSDENFLVSHMLKLPITEEEMEKVHAKVVAKRKNLRQTK